MDFDCFKGKFAPWVGSIIGDTNKKIILITPKGKENEAVTRLSRVGFDNCLGYLKGGVEKWEKDGNSVSSLETIKSKSFIDILKLNKINILDVRKESEFSTKHIEGATNIPLRLLTSRFQEIKNDLCGTDRQAVEIYPPDNMLHDTDNLFHLWVFPKGMGLMVGWTKRDVSDHESPSQRKLGN